MIIDKDFIIGGGISAMVFQYYNPSFTIITPETGGLFGSYIATIHDTPETRKLAKDLGILNPDSLHRKEYIGYYNNGWIQETLTPELQLLLIQKKMSNWNESIDRIFRPESFTMSTAKSVNYMNALDIDPSKITRLLKAILPPVIVGTVGKITDEYIEAEGTRHEYDRLISTIPAPIFWKLYGEPREFPYKPITNFVTATKPGVFHDKFHMVYYDDSVPFSRITHLQGKYAVELTGNMTKQNFQEVYPELGEVDMLHIPFGRIQSVPENKPPNDRILFLGRFSEWKFGNTLEHSLMKSLEYHEKENRSH